MSKPLRKDERPKLTERYQLYTEKNKLHNSNLQLLQSIYERTLDEEVLLAIRNSKRLKELDMEEFWELENLYRNNEMEEFWAKLGQWGDSVRDWFLYYHDKDMSS
jgi:hypothetical protein